MKIKALVLSAIFLLSLSSCSSDSKPSDVIENEFTSSNDTEIQTTDVIAMQIEPDIDELKKKYPEYFELSDFKGIEVYVWQMAENSYRCGMMSGTNRNKTIEETMALQSKSLSIDETKAILNEIGVKKENIIVIPISQPYSSYAYTIDDEYRERVKQLFE